jgi:hypothetical protein
MIDITQQFREMDNFNLKCAFEELQQHEKTGILQNGIIRNMVDQLPDHSLNIINVEYALVKAISERWYQIIRTGKI